MATRDSDNAKFYGYPVKAYDIVKGKVTPPNFEDLIKLHEALRVITQSSGVPVVGSLFSKGFFFFFANCG